MSQYFRKGDVIRYRYNPCGDPYLSPEVWVMIVDPCGRDPALILSGSFGRPLMPGDRVDVGGPDSMWDGRDVVPEEEWPDHICAAIAKWALTQ